jgi:hypothetical protein
MPTIQKYTTVRNGDDSNGSSRGLHHHETLANTMEVQLPVERGVITTLTPYASGLKESGVPDEPKRRH